VTATDDPAAYLVCPRCRLSIRPRARWMTHQHCPRCIARAHVTVELFTSAIPADQLYSIDAAPVTDSL
jgi:hypothetical protein